MEQKYQIDWKRTVHLFKVGIFASLMVLAGDMLLGWGVCDPKATGLPPMLSRYLSVSDDRIYASALLGLIGIPIECLCWFAIYRVIRAYSEKDAHAYRSGIIGCLAFGGCGAHVPCCMAAWLLKRFYTGDTQVLLEKFGSWLIWFLLPATGIFMIFFFLTIIVQLKAFLKGHSPFPGWCAIFSLSFGFLFVILMRMIGDYAFANALATGWISIGNLWMNAGLLIMSEKEMARCSGIR